LSTKLVIFDCDGVLVDSEGLGNDVLAETLAIYGHQIFNEAKTRFRGMKLATCLEILERETGIAADMTVLALNSMDEIRSLNGANIVFKSLDEIHEVFVSQNLSRV